MQSGQLGTLGGAGAYVANNLPVTEDPILADRQIWQACAWVAFSMTIILLAFTSFIIRRIRARPYRTPLPLNLTHAGNLRVF